MDKQKTTGELVNELSSVSNIRDYFQSNKNEMVSISLPDRLQQLADQAGLSRSELAVRSGLDRFYVYDIFRGRKIPGVNKLICLILALGVDLDGAQELFRLAGKAELYARYPRDSVLIYAIQRHLSVDETNELLFEAGHALLSS